MSDIYEGHDNYITCAIGHCRIYTFKECANELNSLQDGICELVDKKNEIEKKCITLEDKCSELQVRNDKQVEIITELQEKVDNTIDFEAVVESKICYYQNLQGKHDSMENYCSSKEYAHKLDAMLDLLEHIRRKEK